MKRTVIGAFLFVISSIAHAGIISIDFESIQSGYVPLPQFETQIIDTQFASLGIIFENAQVGDCTGKYGSGVVHLYGPGAGSCGDITPDINMYFVDPNNAMARAFTTFFSILITDGDGTTINAYDINDNLLTTVTTVDGGFNETLTLSDIGDIAWLNIFTPSGGTAYDDVMFKEVTTFTRVSEPVGLAIMGLALAGIGFARKKKKH